MFKKIVLDNGLRIILVPEKRNRTVTVLTLVKTGSKYETKEINGISHLLEHLFFKGTKKKPRPIDLVEPLDRIGGVYNAFTSEEYTGYFAKVSAQHFDLALDFVSDIYLNSKLDMEDIEKEKGVIIEEINMYYDHPSSYVQTLWRRLLYGDQPAGWDVAGTKESVARISRLQLLDYMRSQYVAENTILCFAGNIPKEKEIVLKVKNYFKKIRERQAKNKKPVVEKQEKPEVLVHKKETDQTHFCLGVRGYDLFDKRKYIQEILALILGGMMSSRLFVRIREELSLAYNIHTYSFSETDTGYLFTQTGVDNRKADKAVSEILKEYKKISSRLVPLRELKKAKENFMGKMEIVLESSDAQASFYANQELLKNEILTPKEIYAKINKITRRDVMRVAQDLFKPQKLNLALIGPFEDKKNFQRILRI